jgi:Bacterial type II/III secretion system short domain
MMFTLCRHRIVGVIRRTCWSAPFLSTVIVCGVFSQPECLAQTAEAESVSSDYSRLLDDATAAALGLTEEQQSAIRAGFSRRDAALETAEDAAKADINAAAQLAVMDVLTDEQKLLFARIFQEPRLKFNFRFQKWADVLDWMAAEAGLSLVMEEAPPGNFNYSDSKEYSPTEAIDLLNGWLLTKGYTLVRRERLLMCLNLTNGLPDGAIPRITLEDLATRGRFEFVSVLIPLAGRPAEETLKEITPLLGTYGKAEMLAATQQLLVSDAAATLRVIQEVVSKVPIPTVTKPPVPKPAPIPELVVYPITHANPVQAGEVLKTMISGTLLVDESASQISINAIAAEHAKARIIIDQLESNQGADKQPGLKLYPARIADATEMLATLQLVFPDAQFRYDEASHKLVAWANKADQTRIALSLEELLAQQPADGPTQLEVYPLTTVAPDAAQTLIMSLLPDVKVTLDSRTGSLIAIGTMTDHQAIRDLLQQLEPQVANTKPAELKSYPIDMSISDTAATVLSSVVPEATVTADAANERLLVVAPPKQHELVAATLTQLAENLSKPDRELKTYDTPDIDTASVVSLLSTLTPSAQITNDSANLRLLVIASNDDHLTIQNVLQQVGGGDATDKPQLKSYPLRAGVSPETITSLLSSLAPSASVTSDAASRRLLITASVKDHELIAATIAQVTQDAGGEIPQLQFYPLQKASAANAASVLSAMLPTAAITFDQATRRLSVVAVKADQETVVATLAKLEATAPVHEKRTLKLYDVTANQRRRFTTVLDSLTTELPGLQVLADAQPDELTVWAKPSQHAIVMEVLTQLDREVPLEQKPRLIVYPITKVDPESVSSVLTELFPDAMITTDTISSRLLIHAKPAVQETIRSAIEQLDSDLPAETEIKLMVYPVEGVDPTSALALLQAEVPKATVIHDATAQTFIVRARLEHQQLVAELLEALQSASSPLQHRSVVVYPTSQSETTLEKTFFESAFPDVTFVLDPVAHTITAQATADEHEAIREAATAMTQSGAGSAEVKEYSVSGLESAGLTSLLAEAVPGARVVLADSKLMAWALPQEHATINKIVMGLRQAPASRTIAAFDITKVDLANAQAVLALAVPDVSFLTSTDGKSLIALVDEHTKAEIETTVAQLINSPAASVKRALRFYDIDQTTSADLIGILATAVPDVTPTLTTNGDRLMAVVTDEQHSRVEATLKQLAAEQPFLQDRVLQLYSVKDVGPTATTVLSQAVPSASISSGARPDQIAVVATRQDHERITEVLQQLIAGKAAIVKKTLAVYDIRGTDPDAVQAVLRPLVSDDVQLTVDPTGRRLYVRALPGQHEQLKAAIDQITADLAPDGQLETKTYLVGPSNADETQEVLLALYPNATIVMDSERKMIVATATAEQHVMIENISKQIAGIGTTANAAFPIVYKMNNVSAADAEGLLSELFTRYDNVRFAVNDTTGRLVAVAREDQHAVIRDLVQQFDGDPAEELKRELAVYRVLPLDGVTVKAALEPLVSRDVTISAGKRSSEILVSAPAEEQKQIAALIQQLTVSRIGGEGLETRTYRLNRGDADAAQSALLALFPDSTLVTDRQDKVLVATASPDQHKTIEKVVQQMNGENQSGDQPAPRSYRLNQADGLTVLEVLENLFESVDDVRLSLDEENNTVIAIARPQQQTMIEQTLADLDPKEGASAYSLQVYPLDDLDAEQVRQVVDDMLLERIPGSKVHQEAATGNLLVTSNQAGHDLTADAIARFGKPEPREMDVFQLTFLEPRTAQTAIDRMISSRFLHPMSRPIIHTDDDTQQLWVQASKTQLSDMRKLLTMMGEVGLDSSRSDSSTRNLRVIPVGGDVDGAIKRIQDLWPRLRSNPIKVLKPGVKPDDSSGQFSIPAENVAVVVTPKSTRNPTEQQKAPAGSGSDNESVTSTAAANKLDSPQPPTPADVGGAANSNADEASADDPPPVVIVPGNGKLTIASDDAEALDQMESLLRAIYSRPEGARNRDFSVYQLTNAGASEVSATLQQIFDDTEGLISFGQVTMVPDERLNALIVYASRSDRVRVEQLLEVLDSEKMEDTKRAFQTEVLSLQYTSASRIEELIQGVYKAELVAGGARGTIAIPKGVPSNVASVLRQINAAASSPLLTIEVQADTNALVIKAPRMLMEEVKDLATRLDEAAHTSQARGVTLLRLKKTNSARVMQILGDVLD